jgi:hypothetical protein
MGRLSRIYSSSEYKFLTNASSRASLPGPNHIVEHGCGEISRCDRSVSNGSLIGARHRNNLCLDYWLVVPKQDQQTSLGPGMLQRGSHEGFDQPAENNLARYACEALTTVSTSNCADRTPSVAAREAGPRGSCECG